MTFSSSCWKETRTGKSDARSLLLLQFSALPWSSELVLVVRVRILSWAARRPELGISDFSRVNEFPSCVGSSSWTVKSPGMLPQKRRLRKKKLKITFIQRQINNLRTWGLRFLASITAGWQSKCLKDKCHKIVLRPVDKLVKYAPGYCITIVLGHRCDIFKEPQEMLILSIHFSQKIQHSNKIKEIPRIASRI